MRELIILLSVNAAEVYLPGRDVLVEDVDFLGDLAKADNLYKAKNVVEQKFDGEWADPIIPLETGEKRIDIREILREPEFLSDVLYLKNLVNKDIELAVPGGVKKVPHKRAALVFLPEGKMKFFKK